MGVAVIRGGSVSHGSQPWVANRPRIRWVGGPEISHTHTAMTRACGPRPGSPVGCAAAQVARPHMPTPVSARHEAHAVAREW